MTTTRIRVKRPTWDTVIANSIALSSPLSSKAGTTMYCIPPDNTSISFSDAMGALKTIDANVPNFSLSVSSLKICGINSDSFSNAYEVDTVIHPTLANTTATCYLCCVFDGTPVAIPLLLPTCP